MSGHHLVFGLGRTGQAVARALVERGESLVVADDQPSDGVRGVAAQLGVDLVEAPDEARLAELVGASCAILPSPGVPDHHLVFALARRSGTPILSEFDLAARWDSRPVLAVTGTNGKTTVTTLATEMLVASGVRAALAGNNEIPLVEAIGEPEPVVFVVEASSFRLGHSQRFAPQVGTWLNFAPDHLDAHSSLAAYEAAKARLWAEQSADQVAIGNADDAVVARHLATARARKLTFGVTSAADNRLDGRRLVLASGAVLAALDELPRTLPHDLANALAAAATALEGGATAEGARAALLAHRGLPHRVALVGEAGGVAWYDDSKATAPHATAAALRGFGSVVLIAGGRNKGLDLSQLAAQVERVRAVVAIGEAAEEVAAVFESTRPVRRAASMAEAVDAAAALARPGDAVLLSPACASHDWYRSYAERGDDFARLVGELLGGVPAARPGVTR